MEGHKFITFINVKCYPLEIKCQKKTKKRNVHDDVSRMASGKQDVVMVRTNSGKEKLQKRHMYMTVKEAFGIFKIENPNIKSKSFQTLICIHQICC